jgi:hypothetical protein
MAVSVYSSFEDLSALDIEILSYKNQKNLFYSIEWFRCLSEFASREHASIRVYVVAGDDDPSHRCYLFCYCEGGGRRLLSVSNFYTMEFAPIFSQAACRRGDLLRELLTHIARERPACAYLNLRLLSADREETKQLAKALEAAGFLVNQYFQFENYYAQTKGADFLAYYNARPSQVRNTIKRKLGKLKRAHRFAVRIVSTDDDKALKDYMEVYAHSWKDREQYPDFMRQLCRLGAELGLLRIGVLYVEDVPVAAQIWLMSGPKAIIYKLAYHESFKEFSVGSILTKEMLESVLQDGQVEEIDYGVGSEPYKQDWMDDKRVLIGLEGFNRRTVSGSMMALAWIMGRFLRRRIM